MNDQETVNRIKYIIKALNYNQSEFSKLTGINASNLSKYLNGKLPITEAVINRIVANAGLNKEWLQNGTDLPFAKPRPAVNTMNMEPLIADNAMRQGTPVYDIDVVAGDAPRSLMFTDDQIIGYVSLPNLAANNCRIVRVSGDSMKPVINNGDYIAIRELSNTRQIFWGQIYVVLLDDYRLIKYVRRHKDPDVLILHSANPDYDDMEVPRNEVRDLMFVQSILHVDTRM